MCDWSRIHFRHIAVNNSYLKTIFQIGSINHSMLWNINTVKIKDQQY